MAHHQDPSRTPTPYGGAPDYGTPPATRDPDDVATQDAVEWAAYRPTPLLDAALDKAVTIPSQVIRAHVDSVRRRNPEAGPAEVIRILEREYLLVIQAAGGAVGAAAGFPAVGTGVGLVLTSSDIATFFASSAAFSLAVADVHGIAVDDVARRRALLLASVLGEKGARDVEKAAQGSGLAWGKVLLTRMPAGTLVKVNKALGNRFLRTQLAKQSGLALGRLVPFGIGAVVGVVGARALGHGVVAQSRRAFGPPPSTFGRILEVVEAPTEDARPTLVPVPEDASPSRGRRRFLPGRRRRQDPTRDAG
ncbi:hypothetical protein [Cellulosimicrobium sp. Marseille-Q4280]|uniref:hypothetical protein n=1 Tax=Cellulosimicrobium sp. Marseille-Q4280 TaxID=2937992 RepID=UPI00203FD776|nr:hypothetical protein [Cellulosimicrobium sp. Marseille-Q4280]